MCPGSDPIYSKLLYKDIYTKTMVVTSKKIELFFLFQGYITHRLASVADPIHFDTDPDSDPT